jgi:SprT protein
MTQYEFCWRKEIKTDLEEVELSNEELSDEELTATARQILINIGARTLAAKVTARWNSRMRSTAGIAYPTRLLICLNPQLRQFGGVETDRTLRHELAHLLAYERAHRRRISAHGPEWKKACEDLGLRNESRTHTLPLPRRSLPKKHFYKCRSCGLEVGRVKPLKRGSACLQCCRSFNRGHYDARFRFVKI